MIAKLTRQAGFTMIELLVVATILIVLTTVALVSFQPASRNARNGKRKQDIETIRQALVLYRSDNGSYPSGNYDTMLTTISDYVDNTNIQDPKEDVTYTYTYSYNAVTQSFSLCAKLEPNATSYCLTNP
jgi:prepilin-type N-terminal cleavage/methylation domain-containing protein